MANRSGDVQWGILPSEWRMQPSSAPAKDRMLGPRLVERQFRVGSERHFALSLSLLPFVAACADFLVELRGFEPR
jgi:hypothetical protein